MPDAIDLDHVALAAERLDDLWPRYAGDLGGRWFGGGPSPGFDWAQLAFANGMRLEGLQPARVHEFDFLRRFLDRSGPGAHHLTFKVPDLDEVLAALARAGVRPASVNRENPGWQEAFLLPADAAGIVVQLAQAAQEVPDEVSPRLPAALGEAAALAGVALLVADLDRARSLYEGYLGGQPVATEAGHVDLAWPGPGRLRLVQATSEGSLAGRPGRLDHLAFTVPDPERVPGAVPVGSGAFEVAPSANLGVRLLLRTC